jgi:uncharacterized UBP type Zn finger protein
MWKQLITRGSLFEGVDQQDAYEFLQHTLKKIKVNNKNHFAAFSNKKTLRKISVELEERTCLSRLCLTWSKEFSARVAMDVATAAKPAQRFCL